MNPNDILSEDEQQMLDDAVLFERIFVFTCGFAVGGLGVALGFLSGWLS